MPLSHFLHMPPWERLDGESCLEPAFLRRVLVDLRFAKTKIKEDFCAWVDAFKDENIPKLDLGTGTKAKRPWHELKELAAYRLAKRTTIKYEHVREFVRDYAKRLPVKSSPNVLPDYSLAGFSKAVTHAEKRINTLYLPGR